jgi:ABC-type Mn2+/Zn2+ transport system ATPase subunit
MRLRYLRLSNLPPLQDIRAVFRQEPLLNRACAIRFVVGVNGTGKTRLLLALAEVFLHLERGSIPPFPVTLAYDIGTGSDARTVLLHSPSGGPTKAVFKEFAQVIEDRTEEDWEALAAIEPELPGLLPPIRGTPFTDGDLPGGGAIYAYLPSVLLAYTSGALAPWESLFEPPVSQEAVAALPELAEGEERANDEAPAEWDWRKENERRREQFLDQLRQRLQSDPDVRVTEKDLPEVLDPPPSEFVGTPSAISRLVTPQLLRYAVCAVTLSQLAAELREHGTPEALEAAIRQDALEERPQPGLRGLLNEVGWLWPPGLHMTLRVDPETIRSEERSWWHRLYELASAVVRQPEPSDQQRVSFDLAGIMHEADGDRSTAAALAEHLGLSEAGPYSIFDRLCTLHAEGRLLDATLTVKKQAVEDLLLYDWLSDGERMFLGRMALFHLLHGKDDALVLLDEPETHFNDVWKRRIVDIIDDSLRDNAVEVVISTHSSIALTDVFDTEITLVRKSADDGSIAVVRTPIQTFGASPSEIMWGVFEAPDVVGQRAIEFLDMVLVVAAYPDQLERVWSAERAPAEWSELPEFRALWEQVQKLPHHYESKERLRRALLSVRSYTQQITGAHTIAAVQALEALEARLGPGAYQLEFRRRLRALQDRDRDVASH